MLFFSLASPTFNVQQSRCIYAHVHVGRPENKAEYNYALYICIYLLLLWYKYILYYVPYTPELKSDVVAMDEVSSKDQRVLRSQHSMDPAWVREREIEKNEKNKVRQRKKERGRKRRKRQYHKCMHRKTFELGEPNRYH